MITGRGIYYLPVKPTRVSAIEVDNVPGDLSTDAIVIESNRRYLFRPADGTAPRVVYLTGVREEMAHGVEVESGSRVMLEEPEALVRAGRLLPPDADSG